jgi:hypothetical protein
LALSHQIRGRARRAGNPSTKSRAHRDPLLAEASRQTPRLEALLNGVENRTPWVDACAALLALEYLTAAGLFTRIGSATDEAYILLHLDRPI